MSGPRLSIIPAAAVLDRRLQRGDLDVLCLLGMSTDANGWTRRSQVKMAKQLEVARSTVQASLTRLVEAGWVEKRILSMPGQPGERDSAHEYRVILDVVDAPKSINDCDGLEADPCRHTGTPADTPAGGADLDRHLINDLTLNDTIPHSVRNSTPPAEASKTVMGELLTVLDVEHARAVIEHRKAMKPKLTAHAAKLLARKFAQMPDPNAAADAMIGNGWRGFEPEWLRKRQALSPGHVRERPPNAVDMLRDAIHQFEGNSHETGNSQSGVAIDGQFRRDGRGDDGQRSNRDGGDRRSLPYQPGGARG